MYTYYKCSDYLKTIIIIIIYYIIIIYAINYDCLIKKYIKCI